jgi:excisionase family DNA binding protein
MVDHPAGTIAGRGNRTIPDANEGSAPMNDELPAPLLKPADVARVLNVTVTQVYTLMRSGDLPALKIGKKGVWRVSRETLETYLADLETEARNRASLTDHALD